ncbi:MAG: hypothetical protein KGI68_14685 [Alphaproteobacteria bacterium]|nr:hypothetical protein [Alphaproteobacteria bacterium]MDE2164299.1 hypothetical protein [Alphaproteobacteria bacterium]
MFKVAAAALLFTALIAGAAAAPAAADWKPVAKALDGIPAVIGVSVLKRINECHFAILKDQSFVETRNVAWPQYNAKAGQTVLQVMIQLPLYKGLRPEDNKPMPAVWLIDRGKATPLSHWAVSLQNSPYPMGYDARTQC